MSYIYKFDKLYSHENYGNYKWDRCKNNDILPFWVAEMDFRCSPEIISALEKRVQNGYYGYTLPTDEVFQAIINYHYKNYQVKVSQESIVFLSGLASGLFLAPLAFTRPDEEVIILTPIYPPFLELSSANRHIIKVPLKFEKNAWNIDFNLFEKSITPKTKLFLFCNPHNPVGRVWSKEEINKLLNICQKNNIIVCSDEVHCDLILSERLKHQSIFTVSDKYENLIFSLHSHSKAFNTPGLNCSYAILPDKILRGKFTDPSLAYISLLNCFGYTSLISAYNESSEWLKQLKDKLRENKKILYDFLSNYPILKSSEPEATYLSWIDVRDLQLKNPIAYFEKYGLAFSDGKKFGNPGFIRFNFACPKSMLIKGLERFKIAIDAQINKLFSSSI